MGDQPSRQWNIFARELSFVLHAHDMKLSSLYDRTIVPYPEKVRRLQRSLASPASFPTLNPEEMELLVATLMLKSTEENRLRAAIVAASVERTLMDRINQDAAYEAADAVFHIVFDAMEEQSRPVFVHIRGDVYFVEPEIPDDSQLNAALDLLDRATFALHAGKRAATTHARTAAAHEAETTFSAALALLERDTQSPDATRHQENDERLLWRDEILRGLGAARSLAQLQEGDRR